MFEVVEQVEASLICLIEAVDAAQAFVTWPDL